MDQDNSKVEELEDDEPSFGEPERLDEDGNPIPVLTVRINAGYGKSSYTCIIQPNGTMILPDGLTRELGMQYGDDLNWDLNEEEGVIYVSVVRRSWEAPDFMDEEE